VVSEGKSPLIALRRVGTRLGTFWFLERSAIEISDR